MKAHHYNNPTTCEAEGMSMSTNHYYNKVGNKTYHFIRTDSGRFSDIIGHHLINRSIDENNGLVLNAKQVSVQYAADPRHNLSRIDHQG